jgi:hypothetical protein
VHGVNDVTLTEIHTAEPPVPESCASEAEILIKKLKRYIHHILIKYQMK